MARFICCFGSQARNEQNIWVNLDLVKTIEIDLGRAASKLTFVGGGDSDCIHVSETPEELLAKPAFKA